MKNPSQMLDGVSQAIEQLFRRRDYRTRENANVDDLNPKADDAGG